jgi:hypothetical protein
MASLLVVVFAVEVAVHIINLIGASVINNLVSLPCFAPPRHNCM